MRKVRVGNWYIYKPVGMDIWDPCTDLKTGEKVKVVNKFGCPRANTIGHCYVDNVEGKFKGLVLCNSLEEVIK